MSSGIRTAWLFALALAAIALVASGCGESASQSTAEGYDVQASTTMFVAKPPITQRQFVVRVNAICRKAWVSVKDGWDSFNDGLNPKSTDRARYAEAVKVPLLAGIDFYIFDAIRMLGAPRGDERTIEVIIGPFQAAVELGQIGRWRAHSASDIVPHFAKYNRGARRYGLDDCLVNEAHLEPFEA